MQWILLLLVIWMQLNGGMNWASSQMVFYMLDVHWRADTVCYASEPYIESAVPVPTGDFQKHLKGECQSLKLLLYTGILYLKNQSGRTSGNCFLQFPQHVIDFMSHFSMQDRDSNPKWVRHKDVDQGKTGRIGEARNYDSESDTSVLDTNSNQGLMCSTYMNYKTSLFLLLAKTHIFFSARQ
jgi:hypothetical protein